MLESATSPHHRTQPVVYETPHPDAAIEWWFMQGYFDGNTLGRRYFMASFFQQQKKRPDGDKLIGHSLLLSHLNPATSGHTFRSQISPGVTDLLIHYQSEMKEDHFDVDLVNLLMDEIKTCGPPRPVLVETEPVRMNPEGLDISWADMAIVQTATGFTLAYGSPEDGKSCHFVLTPATSRIHNDLDAGYGGKMAYASIPRMALYGHVGQEIVQGQAWFDHQWGGYDWFVTESGQRRILGWDWMGINLDDGSDLLLLISRNMETQQMTAQHAIYISPDGKADILHSFTARCLDTWDSPKSLCRYPLDWEVICAEIDLKLSIQPIVRDQEIALFGIMRTIWEGACTATGRKGGQPMGGRARLELHGYGYVFDFRHYLDRWVERIDTQIRDYLPPRLDAASLQRFVGESGRAYDLDAHTTMLSEPVWDMMHRGGKRWRPIFGFLLLQALGTSYVPYEQFLAATIELCHLGSLIIDDIEDASLLRRGDRSIHRKYGTELAISAGNTLYFLPLLLLEKHPALTVEQRERIYQVMVRQYVRTHMGQSQDIYWSKFVTDENLNCWVNDGLDEKVLKMYAAKTAAPVVGLASMVCIIADVDHSIQTACIDFANAFGVAFQIMDDVLNFSTSDKWTKAVGEDLAAGKLTYVIINALQSVSDDNAAVIRRLLCDERHRQDPANVEKGVNIIRRSGVLEKCRHNAHHLVKERWEQLSKRLPPTDAKIMLRLLCAKLTDPAFVS